MVDTCTWHISLMYLHEGCRFALVSSVSDIRLLAMLLFHLRVQILSGPSKFVRGLSEVFGQGAVVSIYRRWMWDNHLLVAAP
jgi:hypothetical protein